MSSGTCNASRRLPATLVFRNGAVLTADPARPVVDALAVAGDRIVAVGDGAGDLAGSAVRGARGWASGRGRQDGESQS